MKIRTQSSGMMSPFEHVNCPPRSEFGLLAHMVGLFGVVVGLTVGLAFEVIGVAFGFEVEIAIGVVVGLTVGLVVEVIGVVFGFVVEIVVCVVVGLVIKVVSDEVVGLTAGLVV